jgi:putative aminopeptidase FrvX
MACGIYYFHRFGIYGGLKMVLEKLCNSSGPSGFEFEIRYVIKDMISGKVDEIKEDILGNIIAIKKGKDSSKRIMFDAHIDEVALIVTDIDNDGFISFAPLGGVDPRILLSKRVLIGENKIPGVIMSLAIHLQDRSNLLKAPTYKDLKIDVGAKSDKGLKGKIDIGDFIVFDSKFKPLGEKFKGKAFDDRAGTGVLIETIYALEGKTPDYDLYFVFAVQEESGLRGATVAAHRIAPDYAFIFEGTTVGDSPLIPKHRRASTLGKGPVITLAHSGVVLSKKLSEFVMKVADENNIPYQIKMRVPGGTDAARISVTKTGVPSAVISVPSRYIHSMNSVIDPVDYENAKKLCLSIINSLTEL